MKVKQGHHETMNVQTASPLQTYVYHALLLEWCIYVYDGKGNKVAIKFLFIADQLNIEKTYYILYLQLFLFIYAGSTTRMVRKNVDAIIDFAF